MSYPYPGQAGPGQLYARNSFMNYNTGLLQQDHRTHDDEPDLHESQAQGQQAQQLQQYHKAGSFSPQIPANGLSSHGLINDNTIWYPPSTDFDDFSFLNHNTAPHAYHGLPAASYPAPNQQYAMPQGSPSATEDDTATHGLPEALKSHTHPFWRTPMTVTLTNGETIYGTGAYLWRYDISLREAITQYIEDVWQGRHDRSQAQNVGKLMAPQQHASGSMRPQASRIKKSANTKNSRKKQHEDVMSDMNPVQAYTPDNDLDTAQKCRDYLAHAGSADIQALNIAHDDWQDVVQNRKHESIASIFDSLTHEYAQIPSINITPSDDLLEHYQKQQRDCTIKVLSRLQSPSQVRRAKALCSLLFDAAVYLHQFGVPAEIYEGHQACVAKKRQVDRKFRLNVDAICSVRMQLVIDIIKSNKLIAMDVLEQKSFERIVRDPEFYLEEKYKYTTSNFTRQQRTDKLGKKAMDSQHTSGASPEMNHHIQPSTKRSRRTPPPPANSELIIEQQDGEFGEVGEDGQLLKRTRL